MRRNLSIFSLLTLLLMIAACNSNEVPSGYPSNRAPYPSQNVPTRFTFEGGNGAIVGRLLNERTSQPAAGTTIHLGKLVPLSPGPGHLINLDLANSPRATVRVDGSFLFEKIEPGEYGILLWTPHQTEQVQYLDKPDRELIVVVEAGKVNDLGTVKVIVP